MHQCNIQRLHRLVIGHSGKGSFNWTALQERMDRGTGVRESGGTKGDRGSGERGLGDGKRGSSTPCPPTLKRGIIFKMASPIFAVLCSSIGTPLTSKCLLSPDVIYFNTTATPSKVKFGRGNLFCLYICNCYQTGRHFPPL